MHYTYVLDCKNAKGERKFYVGYCCNLKKRLENHRNKEVKTTKCYNKLELIYYEACLNKTDARKRELQLKTGFGRGYLKRRIANYLSKRV